MKRKPWKTRPRRSSFCESITACSGRVGAVGFCLGGNLAYLLSVRFKPDCAVGYYGVSIEKTSTKQRISAIRCCCISPGDDKFCPPEAQAQIHATLDANPLVTIHDYPGMEHAFGRTGGEHYDASRRRARESSQSRILRHTSCRLRRWLQRSRLV